MTDALTSSASQSWQASIPSSMIGTSQWHAAILDQHTPHASLGCRSSLLEMLSTHLPAAPKAITACTKGTAGRERTTEHGVRMAGAPMGVGVAVWVTAAQHLAAQQAQHRLLRLAPALPTARVAQAHIHLLHQSTKVRHQAQLHVQSLHCTPLLHGKLRLR